MTVASITFEKSVGGKTHQIFSDKLVVAELVFTQGVGQFNFAGGQKERPQPTDPVLGHFGGQQSSEGSDKKVTQHSIQFDDNERNFSEAMPFFVRPLLSDQLFPLVVLVDSDVEEFDEGNEEEDDADPDDDAVPNRYLFFENGMF
jgi:hypothetical protein